MLCLPITLCHHFGLLFGERLDTIFTSSDSKISGFTPPHVIGFVADLFFPLWRTDLFFSRFAVEFAGCVWTVGVSGKKMLRIQKYPDTCERGLRGWLLISQPFKDGPSYMYQEFPNKKQAYVDGHLGILWMTTF